MAFRAPYDLIMHTQLIRTATKRLDSLHAATYFSPLMTASYDQIGLDRPAQYFASRSCALGAASAELVTATFYSFSPALIGKSVPLCWESTSPLQVHEARLRGVGALVRALSESFGDEDRASSVRTAAVRVRKNLAPVIDAQDVSGRALYAAHRGALDEIYSQADSGGDALFDLWVTTTLLREYRGDGHIAALVSHGLPGLEAGVLDCATGRAWRPSAARRSRGWSEGEWREAASKLVARGLLSDESDIATLTDAGQDLKESIEAATDLAVTDAWSNVSADALAEVREDAKLIAEAVAAAGLIPQKLFGRDES